MVSSVVVVSASDSINGRDFDARPPHYRSVGTVVGDRLQAQAYYLGM